MLCFLSNLTFLAAQVGGAPGVLALESVSVVHGSVIVGASVVRAECLAALLFLALAVVAHHVVGVFDWGVTVGAADGVAVLRVDVVGFVISCKTQSGVRKLVSYTDSILHYDNLGG